MGKKSKGDGSEKSESKKRKKRKDKDKVSSKKAKKEHKIIEEVDLKAQFDSKLAGIRSKSSKISEKEETKLFGKETGVGERKTFSVALPGSILANAQSMELRAYLAGQIARALVVFKVDEVIVFNDHSLRYDSEGEFNSCDELLFNILQYMETPQYLRKRLFPRHKDLQHAGLLNPVDAPHHLRADETCSFREGVVLDDGKVDIGLDMPYEIDKKLEPNTRVTVRLVQKKKKLVGECVNPGTPRVEQGIYWGYQVRLAKSLAEVFTESSFKKGYDFSIGTSENGSREVDEPNFKFPKFKHLLLVFGGVKGLERAVSDTTSLQLDPTKTGYLFDKYLNVCPEQGSRTIRTEEAIPITLSLLRPHIAKVLKASK